MRKITLPLIAFVFTHALRADTVAVDDFLSQDVYQGAVACSKVDKGGDGYLNNPVPVYLKPDVKSRSQNPEKIKSSCATGGGDCLCFALILDEAPGFFKVFTQDRSKEVWIEGKASDKVPVTSLIPTEGDEIQFRVPVPEIFEVPDLSTKINATGLTAIPPTKEKEIISAFPLPIGYLSLSTPGPASKGVMIVTPLEKGAAPFEVKLSEKMDFVYDVAKSTPRKQAVMKREGNKFLIVSENFDQGTYSAINTGRYAFWAEFRNVETKFVEEKFALKDSPLFSGFLYQQKGSETKNNKTHTHLTVSVKMDRMLKNAGSQDEEAFELFKLRDIWIPTTDEKGRLNFFLIDNEGI